jgi:hypothetical protein
MSETKFLLCHSRFEPGVVRFLTSAKTALRSQFATSNNSKSTSRCHPPFTGTEPPLAEYQQSVFPIAATVAPVNEETKGANLMTSSKRYPFWTQDTMAAAVLAGVGTASVQSRLEAWAYGLNIPAVTALVHYWPVLMIIAGLILLLTHPVTGASGQTRAAEVTENSHEFRS